MADGPGVGLWPEADPDRCAARASNERNGVGGLDDGLTQQRGRVAGRGWLVVVAVGVQADDGVEVDDAACLVFGETITTTTLAGIAMVLGGVALTRIKRTQPEPKAQSE